MTNILKGIIAGLVATVVLTLMMFAKGAMGLMPALDPVAMIAGMMGVATMIAWGVHFMIGTVIWGGGFAILEPRLPGETYWGKGVVFGVGAWLIMMVAMMPMAGAGFFGMQLGMMAPVMTLVMHLVFGAVLGTVYGKLLHRGSLQKA
ncbi:hypothetical protein RA2_02501 [Roseovarius sp. A-2]|uniref:DUF6789 family protein n=1 Tax=Roseobacteraceae TaxID=2854170 RepID=UPI0009B58250|nr:MULTISPECIES: DUF6789 family protein [Roseobacteraceae]MDA7430840.1 hypothetical protein [Primorskyibacter aestuariivivens]GAW35438.1 hypothetical protein RA2_02501 [Roseovarius sp. A-2]